MRQDTVAVDVHLQRGAGEVVETEVHQLDADGGGAVAAADGLTRVAQDGGVVGLGGRSAIVGEQDGGVVVRGDLAAFNEHAVRTDRVDRGVVGSVVIVEDVSSVVDDRVTRSFDPVALGGRTRPLEVFGGGRVVCFDEENVDFIGPVGAIGFPDVLQCAGIVVAPAGAAPGGREVDDHLFAFVKEVVKVVLHSVDILSGPVGGNASIRQLRCSGETDKERSERGVNVLHVAGLSCVLFQFLNKEGKYSVASQ